MASVNMSRILLIEDDPILSQGLTVNLEMGGHDVVWAPDLRSAFEKNATETFDLAIVDLGLPDGSGLNFCRDLRANGSHLPMIILTAQADEDSVVAGLEAGANDYVKKPFSNKELLARVRSCLRAPAASQEDQLKFGTLVLMPEQRRVYSESTEVSLNRREFDLLKLFMQQPDVVLTRESIIRQLSTAEEIFDRTIDSHVSHLRAKLKAAGVVDVKVKSEYGVGYRLTNG